MDRLAHLSKESFMRDRESPFRPHTPRSPEKIPKENPFFRDDKSTGTHRRLVLRPRDAAKALGLSTSTLNRLVRAGEIKRIRLDRITLFPVEVLDAWLKAKLESGDDEKPRP
jgi:excisionase family DNA binding protein